MTDLHDLAAPYALDALGPDERDRFEAHLVACESCRAEMTVLTEGAANLADVVAVAPPPRVKTTIMSQVGGALPATSRMPQPRRRKLSWDRLIAVAAAVVAIVFAGLWAATSSQLGHAETVASIYAAADAITVPLRSEVGDAEFVYSLSLSSGVFVDRGLAAPGKNRVYQLWLVDDAVPIPAGTFRPSEDGAEVIVESLEPGLTIAMTEEPAGGSAAPTGDILFSTEF